MLVWKDAMKTFHLLRRLGMPADIDSNHVEGTRLDLVVRRALSPLPRLPHPAPPTSEQRGCQVEKRRHAAACCALAQLPPGLAGPCRPGQRGSALAQASPWVHYTVNKCSHGIINAAKRLCTCNGANTLHIATAPIAPAFFPFGATSRCLSELPAISAQCPTLSGEIRKKN